jgi:hypothetical protein
MEALATADPSMKGELLKGAAREVGYTGPCPLADEN